MSVSALVARVRRLAGRSAPEGDSVDRAASIPTPAPTPAPPSGQPGAPRPSLAVRVAFAAILAVFTLSLSLFMLAARFPDERLRLWAERTLSPGHGLNLSVREARATLFPPGAVLSGLRLRLEGAADPLADMPEARLGLSLWAVCLGRLEVSAEGRTLGGELTVEAASDDIFGGGWREVVITASGLDFGRSPGLPWLVNRHAGGRLSGELRLVPGKTVSGKAGVLLEDAFLEVEGEMLRAVRVELGRMAIRAEYKDGGLDVSECSVASDMLRGGLTGRIDSPGPGGDIRASRLALAGTLTDEVQAEVTSPRPAGLRLTGTVSAPVLTWEAGADSGKAGQSPPTPPAPPGKP
ncbi:hypothetical protein G3N56_17500 [Desulfovibrio sulfodismutans]|uniref:Type II secretion system protein GspN n=1 Tax=Desulfolutivibrio sulfodismutans TaxID=63561 RepID=A0A7K3NQP2_9BACT|nr:hypothetical protein [Desulfolutivibrio sulfodismutans]NDY58532.1 hypothetical protein [Desulfolutivibrio sulfodismutans]QLA14133.1 hypothetical protein GD606_18615 [Desulfolutivibrio sulfodismutans DSM 3696]